MKYSWLPPYSGILKSLMILQSIKCAAWNDELQQYIYKSRDYTLSTVIMTRQKAEIQSDT